MQVSITNVRLKFSYSFFFNSKIITCINWAVSSLMQVLFSCSAKVSQQINRVFKKSGFPWIFKWQVVTHIKIYHSTRLSENLYINQEKSELRKTTFTFSIWIFSLYVTIDDILILPWRSEGRKEFSQPKSH